MGGWVLGGEPAVTSIAVSIVDLGSIFSFGRRQWLSQRRRWLRVGYTNGSWATEKASRESASGSLTASEVENDGERDGDQVGGERCEGVRAQAEEAGRQDGGSREWPGTRVQHDFRYTGWRSGQARAAFADPNRDAARRRQEVWSGSGGAHFQAADSAGSGR